MITYSSHMEGQVNITYTCEHKFELIGNAVRTCQPDVQMWTGAEPYCLGTHTVLLQHEINESI